MPDLFKVAPWQNESEPERLRREADDLDRCAKGLEGCSFYGEHPSAQPRRDASDKRLLALMLEARLNSKENT